MYLNPWARMQEYGREQVERISQGWWLLLLTGIVSVLVGLGIFLTRWSIIDVIVFFGVLLIVRGILQAAAPAYAGGASTWNFVAGIVSIIVGVAVFFAPAYTLLFIATFIGFWLIVTGVFDVVAALSVRRFISYWWLPLVRGLIAIPLGFWALYRPLATLALLIFIFGIWAITIGILEIALATEVRRLPHTLGELRTQPGTA